LVIPVEQAITPLISLGYQRIARIEGLTWEVCMSTRSESHHNALQETGLTLDLVESAWPYPSGYEAMQHFLQLDAPPPRLYRNMQMLR